MAGRVGPALAASVATDVDCDFAGALVDWNLLIGVRAQNWSKTGLDSSPGEVASYNSSVPFLSLIPTEGRRSPSSPASVGLKEAGTQLTIDLANSPSFEDEAVLVRGPSGRACCRRRFPSGFPSARDDDHGLSRDLRSFPPPSGDDPAKKRPPGRLGWQPSRRGYNEPTRPAMATSTMATSTPAGQAALMPMRSCQCVT